MIAKLSKASTPVIAVLFTLALFAAASSPALARGGPRFSDERVAAGGVESIAASGALLDRWSWLQSLVEWWEGLFHPSSIAAKSCAGIATSAASNPEQQSGPLTDPDGCS